MSPTLHTGDIVLVNRLAFLFRDPHINDIVAVKDPRDQKILIKRITNIVDGRYFVTGDNKLHSTDSRKFGMLEKKDIVGKVIF
jgi:signal peptidase I